ncbi:MAG: hypothetical protein ASARMPREDX12_002010 [Alectoria sarmentosa]|nr:MAG: hypothetical protein ASARMPREDX12_002010 [Alectoria sarmentosa]
MSSTTDDSLGLSQLQPALPPPPQYTEATAQRDTKGISNSHYSYSPWLLRRTSIHIESTPNEAWQDDISSHREVTPSVRSNDEKKALRNLLRFGGSPAEDQCEHGRIYPDLGQPYGSSEYGTRAFIEAGQRPKAQTRERHEMKGLEQAASVKRWPGNGNPAEPWGKLAKDFELWDPAGDTLVYYGYQRPQASFRVKSSVLEGTRSESLISMLQEGYRRTPQSAPSVLSASSSEHGVKKFSLSRRAPSSSLDIGNPGNEAQIRHEIHFPAPDVASRIEILRYHITTRNFFAFLLNKPLVGLTFYQALIDLYERLLVFMPRECNTSDVIIGFLTRNRLHNVCNDPAAAAGLLAYSEDDEVQWPEGWREGFVHCSGMYTKLRELPEFRDISHVSRTLLERSHLELQARIQVAEDRLSTFNFEDMWPSHITHPSAARASFDYFRQFLLQFYEKAYKNWPPRGVKNSEGNWLTRTVICHLQEDFGALYDYYVNRDVVWAETKEPSERYRIMVRKKNGAVIKINNDGLDLAKLFVHFDHEHKHPYILHPYPLLPRSMSVGDRGKAQPKQSLFTNKTKALEKQIIHAYSIASNALLLGPNVATNSLVEGFQRFEKTDHLGETDPRDARKGRWILLFGILQILSHVSADTPDLWFKDDVSYYLMPRLKGTPPWVTEPENMFK